MKAVLHVTGDWKWTGPAAPMLELIRAQRAAGVRAELLCPAPEPAASASLRERARQAGVEPLGEIARGRGARPWRDRRDVAALARLVEALDADVVHAWHTRDHWIALRALAARRRAGRTRLVRSLRQADALARHPWNRWLFGPGTDALLCVSPGAAARNATLRGGRPTAGAFGAVDLARFAPGAASADARRRLGLEPDDRAIAVVARVQRRRRFDLLLDAFARLARRDARARLVVIGRGTRLDEVARRPAQRLGLADRVRFTGYLGDDYPEALRAVDLLAYLVPGSDGTCRALLEAAACGVPAVVTRRGALPEIVVDGETGLVVDEDPEALAVAWARLFDDAPLRARFGGAARARAEREFAPARFAQRVAALYSS